MIFLAPAQTATVADAAAKGAADNVGTSVGALKVWQPCWKRKVRKVHVRVDSSFKTGHPQSVSSRVQ